MAWYTSLPLVQFHFAVQLHAFNREGNGCACRIHKLAAIGNLIWRIVTLSTSNNSDIYGTFLFSYPDKQMIRGDAAATAVMQKDAHSYFVWFEISIGASLAATSVMRFFLVRDLR